MTPVSCTEISTTFSKTPVEQPWQRKKIRAPVQDESLIVDPSVTAVGDLLKQNCEIFSETSVSIAAEPFAQLREQCRREILEAAVDYTQSLEGKSELPTTKHLSSLPLVVTGHQPEMFHPGVWVKNFLAGKLAEKAGGVALNLIIDNDNLTTTALRVPTGPRNSPSVEWIAFDDDHANEPWEDARLNTTDIFSTFAARIANSMKPWSISPLVSRMWKSCALASRRFPLLRDLLTVGRHFLERDWGLDILELPLSHLCETATFRKFTARILLDAERFRLIHNRILEEYRRVNRIRSQSHPVPELKIEDRRIETPFWIWKKGEIDRRPLYVIRNNGRLVLSDKHRVLISTTLDENNEFSQIVDVLKQLSQEGFRIRTRALTTTMFSRLFLADLFVHGLGGAKYDEMTDRLIVRFFGMTAPKFVTTTATFHLLPGNDESVTQQDIRKIKQELRRLHYHPDLFLAHKTESAEILIREKKRLIAEQNDKTLRTSENRARYLRLKEIRNELAIDAETTRLELQRRLEQQQQKLESDRFLSDREFSFVLFPEDKLKPFMQTLSTDFS